MTPSSIRLMVLVPIAAVAGAAAFAILHRDTVEVPPRAPEVAAPFAPPIEVPDDPHAGATMPANHPPVPRAGASMPRGVESEEPRAIVWKVPDGWQTAESASKMRLATYRVPPVTGDAEPAEMSVIRAGGSTDANIRRWVGQFEDTTPERRAEKQVRGMKVSVVEVEGTFGGGGMMTPGAASGPKKGWALLGAIVETPGSPYFFKLTGPAATVRAAKPAFDALVDSIAPPG